MEEFHDIVAEGSGEAPVIIFVSNDGSSTILLHCRIRHPSASSYANKSQTILSLASSGDFKELEAKQGYSSLPAATTCGQNLEPRCICVWFEWWSSSTSFFYTVIPEEFKSKDGISNVLDLSGNTV
eukprot:6489549-Amphidinium_carterae.1